MQGAYLTIASCKRTLFLTLDDTLGDPEGPYSRNELGRKIGITLRYVLRAIHQLMHFPRYA